MPRKRNRGALAPTARSAPAPTGGAFNAAMSTPRANDYQDFTDTAFKQVTRTLDPYYDQQRKRFDQSAINKGLSAGTEAYQTEFDNFMRGQNDAYNSAAFNAMQYGHGRYDADRSFDEGRRQFNLSDKTARYGIDTNARTQRYGINKSSQTAANQLAEGGRQFDTAQALKELAAMEGFAKGYRDEDYRAAVFNAQQDQQGINNLMSMMGMIPQGAGSGGAAGSYFDQSMNARNRAADNNQAMWGAIGEAIGEAPWGDIFKNEDDANMWAINTTTGNPYGGYA